MPSATALWMLADRVKNADLIPMSSFALVSMKIQPFSFAYYEAISFVITLLGRSTLLPTSITTIFSSVLSRTYFSHDSIARKLSLSVTSYTSMAATDLL